MATPTAARNQVKRNASAVISIAPATKKEINESTAMAWPRLFDQARRGAFARPAAGHIVKQRLLDVGGEIERHRCHQRSGRKQRKGGDPHPIRMASGLATVPADHRRG